MDAERNAKFLQKYENHILQVIHGKQVLDQVKLQLLNLGNLCKQLQF